MDVRQPNREQYQPAQPTIEKPLKPVNKKRRAFPNGHWLVPFMGGILLSLLVILGAAVLHQDKGGSASDIETDKYQAVFMTNGQVYFGKLDDINSSYADLTDVYYLQVQQAVQPATNNSDQQSQVSLTKLGSELHGPTDKMHISRDQILFWENLKTDSTVVKAINDYQEK